VHLLALLLDGPCGGGEKLTLNHELKGKRLKGNSYLECPTADLTPSARSNRGPLSSTAIWSTSSSQRPWHLRGAGRLTSLPQPA